MTRPFPFEHTIIFFAIHTRSYMRKEELTMDERIIFLLIVVLILAII